MPSPFPGMDPHLEETQVWGGLHNLLIAASVSQLQPLLNRRGYYADPGERVWLAESDRNILPDVTVVRSHRPTTEESAVLLADEPVRIRRMEVREPFIEIRNSSTHRVITGIEFISPSNKLSRDGRKLYRRKQVDLQRQRIHLVEIDLTRRGRRLVDVPESIERGLRRHDYLINLARQPPVNFELYPVRLRDRLPRIWIPLKTGEEDAVLDLQAAFDHAYDAGPYSVRIDYRTPCEPPLAVDDAAWADELLRLKGFR